MTPEYSYYDPHIHGHGSRDSDAGYSDIVDMAKRRGLAGIAITDRDSVRATERVRGLAAEKGLLLFDASAEVMTRLGPKRRPLILALNIPQEELKMYLNNTIRKVRLINYKYPKTEEFLQWIRNFPEGLAVAVHPVPNGKYDSLSYAEISEFREIIDGMEVQTGHPHDLVIYDKSRRALAAKLELAMIGGSDSYEAKNVGTVSTQVPGIQQSTSEVVLMIKKGQCKPYVYRQSEAKSV